MIHDLHFEYVADDDGVGRWHLLTEDGHLLPLPVEQITGVSTIALETWARVVLGVRGKEVVDQPGLCIMWPDFSRWGALPYTTEDWPESTNDNIAH